MASESSDPGDQTVKRPAARTSAPASSPKGDEAPNDLNLSPGVIAAICGGLLVLTIIVFAVFSGGDDDGEESTSTTVVPSGVLPTPGAPTTVAPDTPKEPKGSPEGAPTDDFERADGPVGSPWVTLGDWVIEGGELHLGTPLEGSKQIAVRDMGAADGTVSAIAVKPAGSSGLLFRYVDPKNFWRVSPASSYASWGVFKIVDGKSTLVTNTGLTPTNENTTVTVTMDGPSISVTVDGVERITFEDATHQSATIAGFLTGGSRSTKPRWDDFFALPAGGAAPAPTTTAAP